MPIQRKIIVAACALASTRSGVPRVILDSAALLREAGYHVYVIGEQIDKKSYQAIGVTALSTLRLPLVRGYLKRRCFDWQVQRIARWLHADLIIGHGDLLQQQIVYIHNCAHLAHETMYAAPLPAHVDYGRMHQKILQEQRFSMLICNSLMMQQDLCQRFDIEESKSCVHYPRINPLQFSLYQRTELRSASRTNLGIAGNELLLGVVVSGAFVKRNVFLFIALIDYLTQTQPHLRIKGLIAGNNKDSSYKKKIDSLGLKQTIVIVPSINAPENYYSALDVFVLPAFIEEFGLSVVEAMACGNPVVISHMVGAGELFNHASGNAKVATMSVQAYASALMPLLESAELRHTTGLNNAVMAINYQSETPLLSLIETLV